MSPSKKRAQHTVPACYLRGFHSPFVPPEHANNTYFEPGVWVNDGILSKPWKLRAPRSDIFAESYFYNLPGDSPERPAIEEFLSSIESDYPEILKKLTAQIPLTGEDLAILCAFVITMQTRSKALQESVSSFLGQLVEWHNQMASPTHQIASDAVKIAARQLVTYLEPATLIRREGVHVVVTAPHLPEYVTSDVPVVHGMLHVDEVALLTGRPEYSSTHSRNERFPCWVLPVTPHHAVVASRFIVTESGSPYIECTDEDAIFRMNIRAVSQAGKVVIAASRNPLGRHEGRISHVLKTKELPPELLGTNLSLHTATNRYWLRIERYEDIPDGIRFWTAELDKLAAIAEERVLESLELYLDGRMSRLMREIEIQFIDPSGAQPTEICHKARLDAARRSGEP